MLSRFFGVGWWGQYSVTLSPPLKYGWVEYKIDNGYFQGGEYFCFWTALEGFHYLNSRIVKVV